MSSSISPSTVTPVSTVALPAIDRGARAAVVPITLGAARQTVTIALDSLPPGQQLGALGSIYIDNTANAQTTTVSFPDTQMVNEIPAASAVYILGITGGQRFTVYSPVTGNTTINVLVLNREVNPTGTQPIAGTIVISAGSVTVTNPGPVTGAPVSRSATFPAATNTVLASTNGARKFLLFQMPQTSDGWVNFNGGVAAPNASDSFYMQAGEKFLSTGYVPDGEVSLYVTTGGEVPALEG